MIHTLHLNSLGTRPALRVGLIIDGDRLSAPLASVIEHLSACNFATIELVVKLAKPAHRRAPGSSIAPQLSGRVIDRYDNWDLARHPDEAEQLAEKDWRPLLGAVREVLIESSQRPNGLMPDAAWVNEIRSADLDILVALTLCEPDDEFSTYAAFGLWTFQLGSTSSTSRIVGLDEIADNDPVTRIAIHVTGGRAGKRLPIAEHLAPTVFSLSRLRNLVAPLHAASPLLLMKLHQLHENGWEAVLASAPTRRHDGGQAGRNGFASLGKALARQTLNRLLMRANLRPRPHAGYWRTAVRKRAPSPAWKGSWSHFSWIGPRNHFFADPILIERDGRTWLFVEDFLFGEGRAVISCGEVEADGSVSGFTRVLTRPYHLSFPFIFSAGDEIYMIPESRDAGRIELYRAKEFPWEWQLSRTLLERPGIDTVLHVDQDGTHYFFTSFQQNPNASPFLYVFHSSSLEEPWRLHPASPISLDARYARNGGAILPVDKDQVRVSQDATNRYGSRLHFHRITRLNAKEYAEELIGSRTPDWGRSVIGTHTYTRSSQWEAIDGYFAKRPADIL